MFARKAAMPREKLGSNMPWNSSTKTASALFTFTDTYSAADQAKRAHFDAMWSDIIDTIQSVADDLLATAKKTYDSKAAMIASGIGYDEASTGDIIRAGSLLFKVMAEGTTSGSYDEITVAGAEGAGGLKMVEAGTVFSTRDKAGRGDSLGAPAIIVDGVVYQYDVSGTDLTTGDARTWTSAQFVSFKTAAQMVASARIWVGGNAFVEETGQAYDIVAAATYTSDGDLVRDLTGISGQAVSRTKVFESVSSLQSDVRGYSHLTAGETLQTKGPVYTYEVADSGASDHHLTTAGGVKLYVLPSASGRYNVKAFGAKGDGTTDDSAAIQAAVDLGKATPGVTIYFPKGAFRVVTSIDCTYAGSAAGIASGYYGFVIEGSDQINSIIKCETAGAPTWDMTGKPRMTFRNISFANYSDGAHNPSCMLLLARNTTNGYAGGHVFERMTFRGYAEETGVQCASSEVNKWINVDFETYKTGASGLELTEQIETTVNSEYIDLSSHTFVGGNTRHMFIGCAFNGSSVPSGTHYVRCSGIDNSQFIAPYFNFQNGEAAVHFSDNCSNLTMSDLRVEGSGDYFIRVGDGASVEALVLTGRSSAPIYGEDNSTITKSRIDMNFLATGSGVLSNSIDAYNLTDSDIHFLPNGAQVRNSARGSRFHHYNGAGALSFPTGDTTSPEFYGLSYSGGASDYRRRVHSKSARDRVEHGRVEIDTLVTPLVLTEGASGTVTPDLDDGCFFQYSVDGNITIEQPSNANLGADDPSYGQMITIAVLMDGTGGHSVTFNSAYDLQGKTVDTTANAQTILTFMRIKSGAGYGATKPWCAVL
ncbi:MULTISPECIES: glycosyl hydrolase family 28-related protein [unclassified Mameliella]|nr:MULTISPECIES: glycosyl hydrolase family 28-related protein [unclassified Mameliella]